MILGTGLSVTGLTAGAGGAGFATTTGLGGATGATGGAGEGTISTAGGSAGAGGMTGRGAAKAVLPRFAAARCLPSVKMIASCSPASTVTGVLTFPYARSDNSLYTYALPFNQCLRKSFVDGFLILFKNGPRNNR